LLFGPSVSLENKMSAIPLKRFLPKTDLELVIHGMRDSTLVYLTRTSHLKE
jgi:hypothetical protein